MFIENILGSRTKVKILRVLTEVRTAYALKDLSKETGLSLSITHQAAEELAEERVLIRIKGTKKERLYKCNAESAFASALFEIFKIEKTTQRQDVIFLKIWNVVETILAKTKKDIDLMILFGSQARGTATLRSDIDVLIIPKGKDIHLTEKMEKNDPKINVLPMRLEEFKEHMRNETPLYKNLKKDAIILFIRKKIKGQLAKFLKDQNGSRI